jgi:glycosyltransferase involved in cell wall biosynthesis
VSNRTVLVSVIVPTRNSGRTLELCLRSIRAQQETELELIVVDNNSSDLTPQIAQSIADVFETFGPERSAQRNRGARLSRGQFLLFIDADMILDARVIADCLEISASCDAQAVIIPEVSVGDGFLARCRALERSCYLGDDSIEAARFFSRSSFEESGGFDEALDAMEDWDLSLRIGQGVSLPRTTSRITHDEGRLRIAAVLAKKHHYAQSSIRYWSKHGHRTLPQANLVFRPAFARNWRRLLRHPVLTIGFISLKTLEAGAVASGAIRSQIMRSSKHAVTPKEST